jgi:hypothetical protein
MTGVVAHGDSLAHPSTVSLRLVPALTS